MRPTVLLIQTLRFCVGYNGALFTNTLKSDGYTVLYLSVLPDLEVSAGFVLLLGFVVVGGGGGGGFFLKSSTVVTSSLSCIWTIPFFKLKWHDALCN